MSTRQSRMKQSWRTVVAVVGAVLAVLFIVQISSNYIFDKNSEESNKASHPETVRILSSRRSSKPETSSATPTTKNFSRKLQYAYHRKTNKSQDLDSKKEKGTRSHKHFCWEREDFKIIGECLRCSTYEKRVSASCQETGNRQLVLCTVSKKKSYKSCPHVQWIEARNFWTFEGTMCVMLLISSISVWQRNKKLDAIYQEKLRKKVSNDA